MKATFITPQILLIDMGTMYELGSLFIRMQEFYECPNIKFCGNYFTLDEYMDWYASTQAEKKFTYFEDWAGFNIPGRSLIAFWNLFIAKEGKLRPKEMEFFALIKDFIWNNDGNFCVIGTFAGRHDILEHELRHAYYYLNEDYRRTCDDIFKAMPESVRQAVTLSLLDMGYSATVVPDEAQAYFGTETHASIKDVFSNIPTDLAPWVDKFKNVRP